MTDASPSPDDRPAPARLVASLAVVALALGVVIMTHRILAGAVPFQDEGDHANTARLLAAGGVMYRDAFNEKGPGLYRITAGLFVLFGEGWSVLRGAALAGVLASAILIALLGTRRGKPLAGAFGALIYAALHAFFFGDVWQSESVLAPILLASLWLMTRGDGETYVPVRRFFFAGVALFVATCVKQTAWMPVLAIFVATLWPGSGRVGRKDVVALAAGLGLPWLGEAAAFASVGAWSDFLEGYTFPWRLFRTSTYVYWPSLDEWFFQLPIWLMVLAAAVEALRTRTPIPAGDRRLHAAALFGAVGLLYPSLFAHHLLPLLAVGAWLFAMAIARYWTERRYVATIAWCVNLAVFSLSPISSGLFQWERRLDPGEIAARREIVADLVATTAPSDPVFAFPHDPTYYFDANRQPPGRYGFLLPWTAPPVVIDRFLREWDARPPAVVIYTYLNNCTPYGQEPKDFLAPLLDRFDSGWRIERVYENAVVRLAPDGATDERDRCRVRALFHAGIACGNKNPEWVWEQIDRACPPAAAASAP
ncbi:MAG: glycosyltransferase family 39 protein [Deltaproteobacteria bacterium]|nr:glycosyltransferase family 39 protein [Deltaproteobacteria bacterium]